MENKKENFVKRLNSKFCFLSKKKKIVTISIIIILLLSLIAIPTTIILMKGSSIDIENNILKAKINKKENNKTKDSKKVEESTNDLDNNSATKISDNQDTSLITEESQNNSNTNQNNNNTDQNSNSNNKTTISQNNGGNIQNTPPQTPPSPQPSQQTAWERLGISEYEYYHTPLFTNDYIDFDSESKCASLVQVIKNYCDLDSGYQGVAGKYTGGSIGCRLRIYVNGETYSYSQFKSTEYYNKIPQNLR